MTKQFLCRAEVEAAVAVLQFDNTVSRNNSLSRLYDMLATALADMKEGDILWMTTETEEKEEEKPLLYKIHHSRSYFWLANKRRMPGYYLTNGKVMKTERFKTRKEAEAAKTRINAMLQQERLV